MVSAWIKLIGTIVAVLRATGASKAIPTTPLQQPKQLDTTSALDVSFEFLASNNREAIVRHPIDPSVDFGFKQILGSEHHGHLLIHFLERSWNWMGMIGSSGWRSRTRSRKMIPPMTRCPWSMSRQPTKIIRTYQIEIQILAYPGLKKRMHYNWAAIDTEKIDQGTDYQKHEPVVSIWLMVNDLFPEKMMSTFHSGSIARKPAQPLAHSSVSMSFN